MKLDGLTPEEKAARIRAQKRESYRRRYRDRKFRHAESDRGVAANRGGPRQQPCQFSAAQGYEVA